MNEKLDLLSQITLRLINVKEKNGELWASCPLEIHQDNNPSFSINIDQGIYHCFSCQSSGTVNQLAIRIGLKNEGFYQPQFKPKRRNLGPWQLAKKIEEAADMSEDWFREEKSQERNEIEMDWNERRISEADYYFKRQLLNYRFDCKMEIHDDLRNRLIFEAKHGK